MLLFGLFFAYIKERKYSVSSRFIKRFYRLLNTAIIPTFMLSLLWDDMPFYVVLIGFIGAFLQIISLYYLSRILVQVFKKKDFTHATDNFVLKFIFIAFYLKLLMQLLSASPELTKAAVQHKSFLVIGYIHLFTLAFMSLFILLLLKLILLDYYFNLQYCLLLN